MNIEFVNHASIVTSVGDVRIISDPWLEGRVFDEGWALISPSSFTYADFEKCSHIWFSHEHPDHFLPANIKKIDPEIRARLSVLFQATKDKKVVDFCKHLKFGSIQELAPGEWVNLESGVNILNRSLGTEWEGDSWLAIRSEVGTLLNINDCGVTRKEAREIKSEVGEIDVLCTQFSYAAWQGNIEDALTRRETANYLLERLAEQIEILKPKYVIPFASFVWFCSVENFYLNAEMNLIRDVYHFIESHTQAIPIVLYPGDRWDLGDEHDSEAAMLRYESDLLTKQDRGQWTKHASIDFPQLETAAKEFHTRLFDRANGTLVRLYLAHASFKNRQKIGASCVKNVMRLLFWRIDPVSFFADDLNQSFAFRFGKGLAASNLKAEECDLRIHSSSLLFCLQNDFGGETLQINGRFQERSIAPLGPRLSHANRLFVFTGLARRINLGYDLSWKQVCRWGLGRLRKAAF